MSHASPVRPVRKGTKSCTECRHRKIRCIWLSEDADACRNCLERRRSCVPQEGPPRDSKASRLTSRDRIRRLEDNVSALWKHVQTLEGSNAPRDSESRSRDVDLGDASDSESTISEPSPANQPTHLRQFFEHGPLGWSNAQDSPDVASPAVGHTSKSRLARARAVLLALVPGREEVAPIVGHSMTWMHLAQALFPVVHAVKAGDEILSQWDKVQDSNVHPTLVAVLLLSIAVTVQQIPPASLPRFASSSDGRMDFIRKVSEAVETTIVMDDAITATLEGIETSILWMRLQLNHARPQRIWIVLRRVIAMAELIGLPKATLQGTTSSRPMGTPSASSPSAYIRATGASLWKSICTVDRLSAMMFGFPLGTAHHPYPIEDAVAVNGRVISPAYLCHLAEAAGAVQEIDSLHASGMPPTQLCEKVLRTDQQLRALAGHLPRQWWDLDPDRLGPEHVLQHFHQYLTARTHLQLALRNGDGEQFAYSNLICMQVCQDLMKRYVVLRRLLPAGFFACRVVDLQVLTAAIFLLHRRQDAQGWQSSNASTGDSITRVCETLEAASKHPGGDLALQAAHAIRSMSALLEHSGRSELASLTFRIPLLGKVAIKRMSAPHLGTHYEPNIEEASGLQGHSVEQAEPDSATQKTGDLQYDTSLPWSMEVFEDLPFLTDEAFSPDAWLAMDDNSFGGSDGFRTS